MKQYYLFDEQGFFVCDTFEQTEHTTDVRPPQPCWKPKWDGEKWVETATDEEMNPPEPTPQPTTEERIEALENAVLELIANV